MNTVETIFEQRFAFEVGTKLTELVNKYGNVYVLYHECRYSEGRPVFKISTSDNDIKQLFSAVKPNVNENAIFKHAGVITEYEPLTGRKYYKLALLCATKETNPDLIELNLKEVTQRIDNVWSDISKNNNSGFIGCKTVTEVNDNVLRKLGIIAKDNQSSQIQRELSKVYDTCVHQFRSTLVTRVSLHVPFTRITSLTEKDFNVFYGTLNKALVGAGKSELAGQLHSYRNENNAGCFDVVLFLNGDEVSLQSDSFMEVMKLIEDSWHVVSKHRFVTSHFSFITNKEREAVTSLLKRHVVNPLCGI